jgi:hypothetical protein
VDSAFDIAAAVRVRSWTAPVLSPPSQGASTLLHDPEFVAAVGRAQRAQSVEAVQIGDALVACVVLRIAAADAGVLVVSRRLTRRRRRDDEDWSLERIASFLRPAIEGHLESDFERSANEVQRLTALHRALSESEESSELDAVRVFGTAVSIWEDAEVRAYHETVDGDFVQQWAPDGASAERIPIAMSLPPALRTRELSRIPLQNLDQLGISTTEDVVLAYLEASGSRWILLFTDVSDPASLGRLALYVDVLEQSLKQLTVAATLEVCRRIWEHLLDAEVNTARSADAALREVVRSIGGDFAALVVDRREGGDAVAVGDPARFKNLKASDSASLQQVIVRPVAPGGSVAVAVGRVEGRAAFSSAERHLLDAVADMLETWAAEILHRPLATMERRSVVRPFQQLVEEAVQNTIRSGASVSVVVIRLGEVRPGLAHRLAAQIRAHLRAAEPAGALADGEIAAVLFDASADQARAVVNRLRNLGPSLEDGDALMTATMGIAHCAAGSTADMPLIVAARQDALRSASHDSRRGQLQ